MNPGGRPQVILVAGMLRSGSTWLYNAARLLLQDQHPDLLTAWVEDYDPAAGGSVHLVKAHNPRHVTFTPDIVLTTWRPLEACVASLVRMGWRDTTPENLRAAYQRQTYLYRYWRAYTDLELDYDQITQTPAEAVTRLMVHLGQPADTPRARRIAQALDQTRAPKAGPHDATTLLHPGHRANPDVPAPITAQGVTAVLESISHE